MQIMRTGANLASRFMREWTGEVVAHIVSKVKEVLTYLHDRLQDE